MRLVKEEKCTSLVLATPRCACRLRSRTLPSIVYGCGTRNWHACLSGHYGQPFRKQLLWTEFVGEKSYLAFTLYNLYKRKFTHNNSHNKTQRIDFSPQLYTYITSHNRTYSDLQLITIISNII